MRLRQAIQLLLLVLKIPFHLVQLFLLNLVNYVSPSAAFQLIEYKVSDPNHIKASMSKSIKSTNDMGYLFSLDRVKVNMS